MVAAVAQLYSVFILSTTLDPDRLVVGDNEWAQLLPARGDLSDLRKKVRISGGL